MRTINIVSIVMPKVCYETLKYLLFYLLQHFCQLLGPRWASWNLGIFLCIRCAGIHRNLGVHISRVKSVNLDSWTPEQVTVLFQTQITEIYPK